MMKQNVEMLASQWGLLDSQAPPPIPVQPSVPMGLVASVGVPKEDMGARLVLDFSTLRA